MKITWQTRSDTIPAKHFRVLEMETNEIRREKGRIIFQNVRTGDVHNIPLSFVIAIRKEM